MTTTTQSRRATFELQGHRGARGLKPENTLASFEVAFDLGVSSIETDVHLTADSVPILFHDSSVSDSLYHAIPGKGATDPGNRALISSLTLDDLRKYRADRNPDPARFPNQDNQPTPAAKSFAALRGLDLLTPPTLPELFAFATAYAGDLGKESGKSEAHRARASKIRFDLELKRVPFRPAVIGDAFDGQTAGLLEQRVIQVIREAGMTHRTRIRSFDHRCVRLIADIEPGLERAILIAGTAPVSPAELVLQAGAQVYCPEIDFLDELQVRQIHESGFKVIPWTVNDPGDWQKLLDWGVDGITTDFPDRLAAFLNSHGVPF
ncbi:MAG TPA: glycerophosphodiester phosphodiesterase family protein [Gemmataceae bacterium]|jgi:glycerophosphoryl diester phosphodiesterase|nr:glycerophosphodiester phosphodiesterase family protein [Gemmataceae bacterium]